MGVNCWRKRPSKPAPDFADHPPIKKTTPISKRTAIAQPLQQENHQERPFQARSGNGLGGTWEAMDDMRYISPKWKLDVKTRDLR